MPLLTLPELLTPVDVIDGAPVVIGPAPVNDNRSVSKRDGVMSIALSCVEARWVVSAFRIGVDGEPDYDRGEIFVKSFERETLARWLYQGSVSTLQPSA